MAREMIKYAAMFRDRHYFPAYVKDYVFDGQTNTYEPMNIGTFKNDALNKFLKWKKQGFTCVYVYMSGLLTATISMLNAAWLAEMPIKLYHFSFLQDMWLPQEIEFSSALGYNSNITDRELNAWVKEVEDKKELDVSEYQNLVGYVRIFKDLVLKYSKEPIPDWRQLKGMLFKQYKDLRSDYLDMMAQHLYPLNSLVEGRKYNERLKERILRDRESPRESYNSLSRGSVKTKGTKAPKPLRKGGTYKRENNHRGFR